MVKLVRFLRVMLVVFRMSGILLVVFVSCNVLFTCLLVAGIKVFPSLLMKKNEKIFVVSPSNSDKALIYTPKVAEHT